MSIKMFCILHGDEHGCPQEQSRNANGRQKTSQQESLEQASHKNLHTWLAVLDAVILEVIELQLVLVVLL